ncbi:hypothetical protein HJA87_03535 [Rhizobium bangladeshense]|uniref:Uncharacterized protein n=1 Tax=Rhizobium bangladeshense TaxID=1138189 RepID=A0ABS7LBX2_9HYPH|nr:MULTISPECIES: hypothetical protein [Rhizobium]MBX4866991.1 hypothetical protein [Rhizobium bangladeshense]MBX4874171.1 hypothetical protein [Rhizobium bangladeshense]MBX4883680.1 hypothetical protein [Rhizobium bangladeshense]MBX4900580.1 hypothetical protein [Rhizobium bangladeshense]MBY3588966.1 hypothetical protein [Rhizobium bangladeshense]
MAEQLAFSETEVAANRLHSDGDLAAAVLRAQNRALAAIRKERPLQ